MLGLIVSQMLPGTLGAGYAAFKKCSDTLLYICLGFIMINVGREFEIDKTRWRSYTADYFIAMATASRRVTTAMMANICHRRPVIRICRGIISRMVSRSSKMASTCIFL